MFDEANADASERTQPQTSIGVLHAPAQRRQRFAVSVAPADR
jgi:hypothetical protein